MTNPPRKRKPPRWPLNQEPAACTYAREKAGLTRTALAKECEVSLSLISEIEGGTRNAAPALLQRMAEVMNCPVVWLERKRDTETGKAVSA